MSLLHNGATRTNFLSAYWDGRLLRAFRETFWEIDECGTARQTAGLGAWHIFETLNSSFEWTSQETMIF